MSQDLTDALAAHLATLPIGVYVGDVPDNLPADDSGRVKPYAVIWPTVGWTPDDARSVGGDDSTDPGTEWPIQITVAAGSLTWCGQAADLVRSHLAGHRLTAGAGPLRLGPGPAIQPDDDVHPRRWFVPLSYRCLTN